MFIGYSIFFLTASASTFLNMIDHISFLLFQITLLRVVLKAITHTDLNSEY